MKSAHQRPERAGRQGVLDRAPRAWQAARRFPRRRLPALLGARGLSGVHKRKDVDWTELANLLQETVIRRVIRHDLLNGGGRRRDSALLEALLQLACRYAGLAPAISELAEQVGLSLHAAIDGRRLTRYLSLLADTLLVRLIPPLDVRLSFPPGRAGPAHGRNLREFPSRRNRGGPKLCLADHALRACWLQERIPLSPDALAQRPELTTQAGHLAESVFGSAASTVAGLDVAHWPARGTDREVDFVLTVGVRRIPIEIRYQRRIDQHRDTAGLRSFLAKTVNNASFGVLITQDATGVADDRRIVSLPLDLHGRVQPDSRQMLEVSVRREQRGIARVRGRR